VRGHVGIVEEVRILVLADTHLKVAVQERFSSVLLRELERADLIFHAGDITKLEALESLHSFAPVIAVLGNNDTSLTGILEPVQEFSVDGLAVAIVHDSGTRQGRETRMHQQFPGASLVVYGHSHIPDDSIGRSGQRLFNPGSPTTKRSQPVRTYGILEIVNGEVTEHRIEVLD
jgi:hypothetical protein